LACHVPPASTIPADLVVDLAESDLSVGVVRLGPRTSATPGTAALVVVGPNTRRGPEASRTFRTAITTNLPSRVRGDLLEVAFERAPGW